MKYLGQETFYKNKTNNFAIYNLILQVKISFPPDVWMLEEKVVGKEGGNFVVR